MKELTRAEEQIMQVLWDLGKGFVKDIIDKLPEPRPAYNTVSTIVRILQDKGFVGHETFGKSHCYYPLVAKEAGTTGELVYEGKNVMLGYAKNRSDLSKGDECRGILFTGDMARRDEAGFYYIEGRKKRFLKLFGNRISLDGTERLLKHHFGGCDFACTGNDEGMKIFMAMPKESMGSPGHCALPKPEETALFLEKATKLSRRVFEVITVGEIPKNDAGKVLYKKLEELP